MKNTEAAFNWIIDILEGRKIGYKISGGLAARTYGAKRELADIDIDLADEDIYKIVDAVRPHIIFGPARYKDKNWDLLLMTLEFEGQEIDLAGSQAKIFNRQTSKWETCQGDLKNVKMKEVFGRLVPVEPREALIAFKSKLAREVDLEDNNQLRQISPNN